MESQKFIYINNVLMKFDAQDYYFLKAKKEWYIARSIYKLQEINDKYRILNWVKTVIDIWCAPWSWAQFVNRYTEGSAKVIWFDLKEPTLDLSNVFLYKQDVTDMNTVRQILSTHDIEKVDCILSDMAPDTIGNTKADAMRSIWLLEETLWLYEELLKENWTFAIKVFMWPWYEEFYHELREKFWWAKCVKIFKPKACRKKSKETYIVWIWNKNFKK